MTQALATLNYESLQRRWPWLQVEHIERIRSEEELISVIAEWTGDSRKDIQKKLREARKEAILELPRAVFRSAKARMHSDDGLPARYSQSTA